MIYNFLYLYIYIYIYIYILYLSWLSLEKIYDSATVSRSIRTQQGREVGVGAPHLLNIGISPNIYHVSTPFVHINEPSKPISMHKWSKNVLLPILGHETLHSLLLRLVIILIRR